MVARKIFQIKICVMRINYFICSFFSIYSLQTGFCFANRLRVTSGISMFTIICTYWKISRLINIFRSNLLIALSVSSALSQELGSTSMLETLCTYNGPLTWTISSQFLNRNVSRDAYPEIRMRLNKLLDWTTWHKRIDNYLFVVKFFVIRESWYILYFKILF